MTLVGLSSVPPATILDQWAIAERLADASVGSSLMTVTAASFSLGQDGCYPDPILLVVRSRCESGGVTGVKVNHFQGGLAARCVLHPVSLCPLRSAFRIILLHQNTGKCVQLRT